MLNPTANSKHHQIFVLNLFAQPEVLTFGKIKEDLEIKWALNLVKPDGEFG